MGQIQLRNEEASFFEASVESVDESVVTLFGLAFYRSGIAEMRFQIVANVTCRVTV